MKAKDFAQAMMMNWVVLAPLILYSRPLPGYYLSYIKQADIAGIGSILNVEEDRMKIAVSDFWLGVCSTNVIEVDDAGLDFTTDVSALYGKQIVFFAITNQWKNPYYTNPLPADFGDSWEYSLSLTNRGPACPPKFSPKDCAPWFLVGSNDIETATFFSNVVESVFINRDHGLYYRTLRDAIRSQSDNMKICNMISIMPMYAILSRADETNLVEMLYDPFLTGRFRNDALFYLKKNYDWPATNTVPEL